MHDQVAQAIADSLGSPGVTRNDVTITGPDANGEYTVTVDVTGANGGEGYTDREEAENDVLAALEAATAGGAGAGAPASNGNAIDDMFAGLQMKM